MQSCRPYHANSRDLALCSRALVRLSTPPRWGRFWRRLDASRVDSDPHKQEGSEQNKPSEGLTGTSLLGKRADLDPLSGGCADCSHGRRRWRGQERGEGFAGGWLSERYRHAQEAWDAENPKEIKDYTSAYSPRQQGRAASPGLCWSHSHGCHLPAVHPSTLHGVCYSLVVRTPQAPLDGTEEEANPLRYITDQGKEYDSAKQRGKNVEKALGFTTTRPPSRLWATTTPERRLASWGH